MPSGAVAAHEDVAQAGFHYDGRRPTRRRAKARVLPVLPGATCDFRLAFKHNSDIIIIYG